MKCSIHLEKYKMKTGMKAWCKLPQVTRVQLLCTITAVGESGCHVDLPSTIRGVSRAFVSFKDMDVVPAPKKKQQVEKTVAPPDSPYGKIKQRLVEMSRSKPPSKPAPKREEPIQKQVSKEEPSTVAGSLYQLLNPADLTREELELMQEIQKEQQRQ